MKKPYLLTLICAALGLASCSLPPSQAWRIVKTQGLLPYVAMELGKKPFPPGVKPLSTSQPKVAAAPATPVVAPKENPYLGSASKTPAPAPALTTRKPLPANMGASTTSAPKAMPAADAEPKTVVTKPAPRLSSAPVQPKRPAPKPEPAPVKKPATPPTKPAVATAKPKMSAAPVQPKPAASATKPATAPTTPKTSPAPAPKKDTPPQESKPATTSAAAKVVDEGIPFGIPIPGRPGLVNSPFAGKLQIVDVSGLKAGQEVKCPFSGKLFRVPSGDTAVNKAAPPASPEAAEPQKK